MPTSGVVPRLIFASLALCMIAAAGLALSHLPWLSAAWAEVKNPPTEAITAPPKVETATLEGKEAPSDATISLPFDIRAEATQVGGYLLVLVVLAILVIYLGKRFRPRWRGGSPIFIEDGRNLAPGVGVRLIRVGARYWLIGVTKEQVTLLGELSEEDVLEDEAEPSVDLPLPKGRQARVSHEDEPVLVDRSVRQ